MNVKDIRTQCEELRKLADKIELLTYLPNNCNENEDPPVKVVVSENDVTRVCCSVCKGSVDSFDLYCRHCGVEFRGWKEVESKEDIK